MADTDNLMDKSVSQFNRGLHTDNSPQTQPEGSLRFALNSTDETEIGDMLFPTNLESNEVLGSLPENYTPIGKCYMGDGKIALFLVGPNKESEIGIYEDSGVYTTHVNDSKSSQKLNFSIQHQIDAVYRLRRGCDHTIYWTDNLNPVRHYIFNKPEDYLVSNQDPTNWSIENFSLFKRWSPASFESINVLETGTLKAGSYNIAIQYLDSDLNPTEWFAVSDTINIYHDSLRKNFKDIRGSSNLKTSFQDWGESTGKSIEVIVSNLDTNFLFYRLALIQATNGSGLVSKVTVSKELSTSSPRYLFENNEGPTITIEEISQTANIIDTAQSIEQVENRLILGNTKGKQRDFCQLQHYASQIISNYKVETVILDRLEDNNRSDSYTEAASKDPLVNLKKIGYMPGEIYSFGIVYYFKDGSTSPVYHIPGRPANDTAGRSNMPLNNVCSSTYTDSTNCSEKDYWGKDFTGTELKGANIRHHRFPTRKEAGIGFVEPIFAESEKIITNVFSVEITVPKEAEENQYTIYIKLDFEDGGILTSNLSLKSYTDQDHTYTFIIGERDSPDMPIAEKLVSTTRGEELPEGTTFKVLPPEEKTQTQKELFFTAKILGIEFSNINIPKSLNGEDEIVGYKIVRNIREEKEKSVLDSGVLFPISVYEKFLAFGHLAPNFSGISFKTKRNLFAFIHPEFLFNKKEYTQSNIKLVSGGDFVSSIRLSGENSITFSNRVIEESVEDTYPGTTYDPAYHKGSEKDSDGLTLHTITRVKDVYYDPNSNFSNSLSSAKVSNIFYLDALSSKSFGQDRTDIYNISSDNKIGIIEVVEDAALSSPFRVGYQGEAHLGKTVLNFQGNVLSQPEVATSDVLLLENKIRFSEENFYNLPIKSVENFPYFYMVRPVADPYSDFRYSPFYSEHPNMIPASNKSSGAIFHGDSYISPMTYNNTFFHDIKPKKRATKNQTWKFILGVVSIVAGVAGALFTGGTSLSLTSVGIGLLGISAGISLFASGVHGNKLAAIYQEKYEEGLKYVTRDGTTNALFVNNSPTNIPLDEDDEIQWYNDVIAGLWFESQINFGVRQGNTLGLPDFIDAPFDFGNTQLKDGPSSLYKAEFASNQFFKRRSIEKLSILDPEASGGRLYQGFATAEFYEVNKDFLRREREKPFFHLGLEYDCCSDCVETFPHRIHYSEQSFQEENTDNFRIFLPNNYRDIPGETGAITNIFKIQNNLFVHTEEAIWNLPKNYQERVTDQIVSFVGTGDYFSIPPQKLVDDETGNSYGTKHKWSRLKTPYGYFFVSENQNCICQFDGNRVKNLSENGNYYWFYNHIPILGTQLIKDNPSNPNGSGFIAVFDSKKDLIFFTKKDKLPSGEDVSWTISYNLQKGAWGSWHSFMPNFYLQTSQWYFSWITGNRNIWRHNKIGHYQTYYGKTYPFIIEYVINNEPLVNKTFNDITIQVESKKYDDATKTFFDTDRDFFTKMLAYNARQCTGEVKILVKDKTIEDFFSEQVKNSMQTVIADRLERDWHINELRDMVVTKDSPMFTTDVSKLQDEYFIDKKLNPNVIDFQKDWTQIENFRDKYLVVRFIFDNFANVKLITNFTLNTETRSLR